MVYLKEASGKKLNLMELSMYFIKMKFGNRSKISSYAILKAKFNIHIHVYYICLFIYCLLKYFYV